MAQRWLGLIIALTGVVLVLLVALYARQRALIYFPQRLDRAEFDGRVRATFGERASIIEPYDAVVVGPPPSAPATATALVFHGNAGLGIDRGYLVPEAATRGLRLVIAEYPGYGARAGSPTEATLIDDACALYREVRRRFPDDRIILIGESLGSGVAVQVAAREKPSRLVLLVPFLSLAKTAARAYPFLPAQLLLKDRFDSARALRQYQGPVALLVAGRDEVVGADQGRALAEVARGRGETTVVEIEQGHHNDWSEFATASTWTRLLGIDPAATRP